MAVSVIQWDQSDELPPCISKRVDGHPNGVTSRASVSLDGARPRRPRYGLWRDAFRLEPQDVLVRQTSASASGPQTIDLLAGPDEGLSELRLGAPS